MYSIKNYNKEDKVKLLYYDSWQDRLIDFSNYTDLVECIVYDNDHEVKTSLLTTNHIFNGCRSQLYKGIDYFTFAISPKYYTILTPELEKLFNSEEIKSLKCVYQDDIYYVVPKVTYDELYEEIKSIPVAARECMLFAFKKQPYCCGASFIFGITGRILEFPPELIHLFIFTNHTSIILKDKEQEKVYWFEKAGFTKVSSFINTGDTCNLLHVLEYKKG